MNLWNRIRFQTAFWGGKAWLEWIKLKGKPRNDRPGMVSMRLYPDFLYHVAKPKLTIVVTGTNGKTTISGLICDMMRSEGKRVAFNDWGANHHAGVARNLLGAVNWFNRPVADVAVIELDELISPEDMPALQPDYIIVSNLGRDSMLRNGHPDYIRSRLAMAIASAPKATVILNADDPISGSLGEDHRRLYFGIADQGGALKEHLANDFVVCPRCGAMPVYRYRTYRHMGRFRCPGCGMESPTPDVEVQKFHPRNRVMTVREGGVVTEYQVPSDSMHNVSNAAAVVTLFRDLGYERERVVRDLRLCAILPSRESRETVGGVELITHIAKAQNPTAVSTVMEYLAEDRSSKEVVMILDEVYENPLKTETVAWEYDTDFEFLNEANVRRVIFTGARSLDMQLRLLLAGIPREKLVRVDSEEAAADAVDWHGVEKVYVFHDVNAITRGRKLRDRIHDRIRAEGGADHEA